MCFIDNKHISPGAQLEEGRGGEVSPAFFQKLEKSVVIWGKMP